MLFGYNIFLRLYKAGISVASLWNEKAKKWIDGRKDWQRKLTPEWIVSTNNQTVWMHCASLGEFEQGRPILEKIKLQFPHARIILTFFSPSGYEIRKNYEKADYVMYLPLDSKENAAAFLDLIKPQLAIFVKYEFWHYYIQELKNRKIETILVSGIFRSSQPFFQWWGSFHRNMLNNFSHLFVQNKGSKELLDRIGLGDKTTVAGDTRFDRVLEAVEQWKPVHYIDLFADGFQIIVCGSTWKEDEELLRLFLNENWQRWRLIIAPHEINESNITRIKELYPDSVRFSELNRYDEFSVKEALEKHHILIIDTIGLLSKLYKYATVCYVGGGFNKSGHHNILEAAVYGKPVITGPNFQKFKESVDLKKLKGSFAIENATELKQVMLTMNIEEAGKIAENYVRENGGATDAIFNWLQEKRLFTNA